jgi:hypothetical protein
MFNVGDLVLIVSNLKLPINNINSLVNGKVVRRAVYNIVVECEDGKFIEGDMDELALFRGLRHIN